MHAMIQSHIYIPNHIVVVTDFGILCYMIIVTCLCFVASIKTISVETAFF